MEPGDTRTTGESFDRSLHDVDIEVQTPKSDSTPNYSPYNRPNSAPRMSAAPLFPVLEQSPSRRQDPRHIPIVTAEGLTVVQWQTTHHNSSSLLSLGSTLPGDFRNSLGPSTRRHSRASWGNSNLNPPTQRHMSATTLKDEAPWAIPPLPFKENLEASEKGSIARTEDEEDLAATTIAGTKRNSPEPEAPPAGPQGPISEPPYKNWSKIREILFHHNYMLWSILVFGQPCANGSTSVDHWRSSWCQHSWTT